MSEEGIKGELEAAKRLIVSAAIASCNCNTKSPEPVHHEPTCRYWKLMCALERVEGAEEDGAAVEAKLAAIIDNINRYGLTQVPAAEKRPELEELRRLIGPYAPMVEAWNRRADPAPQPATSTVEVEPQIVGVRYRSGYNGRWEAAWDVKELPEHMRNRHPEAEPLVPASVLSAALEDKKRAIEERDEARAFAEAWHKAVQTTHYILGLGEPDADTAAVEVRDTFSGLKARADKAEAALRPFAELADIVAMTGASQVGGKDLLPLLESARAARASR